MSKKKNNNGGRIVYSTDPSTVETHCNASLHGNASLQETQDPAEQQLTVRLDSKHRRGKVVTLVEGFKGKDKEREALGKTLKSQCGTGGTVKDGLILIQGDYAERIKNILRAMGYKTVSSRQ